MRNSHTDRSTWVILLTVPLVLSLLLPNLAAQSDIWAFEWAVQGPSGGAGIAVDAAADVYVVGEGGASKLDPDGNVLWYWPAPGFSSVSIAPDAWGNVYTAGQFAGGTFYVAKIDSLGTFEWAVPAGVWCVAVDGSGNALVTGHGLVSKMDPSGNLIWDFLADHAIGGIAAAPSDSVCLTGDKRAYVGFMPYLAAVVSKLDSQGSPLWQVVMTSPHDEMGSEGTSIAVDAAGNVYTTGVFHGTTDFDPGPGTFDLTSIGVEHDIFVSKLDASGEFVWAVRIGGGDTDFGEGIAVDGSGNVYATGTFLGAVDFDPGPGVVEMTGAAFDRFILKLDTNGCFAWVILVSEAGAIAADDPGNIYRTGVFSGTVDFDPGPGVHELASVGGSDDRYISRLSQLPRTTLLMSQPGGAGAPLFVENGSLIPGGEYFNVFSTAPCSGGPGSGNPNLFGMCPGIGASTQLIIDQLLMPVGAEPFHFLAPAVSVTFGPYGVPPTVVEGVCFELSGLTFRAPCEVVRFTVQ